MATDRAHEQLIGLLNYFEQKGSHPNVLRISERTIRNLALESDSQPNDLRSNHSRVEQFIAHARRGSLTFCDVRIVMSR